MSSVTMAGAVEGTWMLCVVDPTFVMTVALFVVDALVRLGLGLHLIMSRRPVSTTLAWLMVLVFAPVVGIFLYLLIGENRLGSARARLYDTIEAELEPLAVRAWEQGRITRSTTIGRHDQIARFGTAATGLPPIRGNRLAILAGWEDLMSHLIRDIDGATDHCHLVFYIWQAGGRSDDVAEALMRAAERGVACRLLLDAVGSRKMLGSEMTSRLRSSGVEVVSALPVSPARALFRRLDLRNHRKIAVIDGVIGYAGSQNMTDDTFGAELGPRIGPWVDASLRIEGPAAQALGVPFLRDWTMDSDKPLDGFERFLREDVPVHEDGSVVQVLPTGPGLAPRAAHDAVLTMIYAAKEELIITTPYFVPDGAIRAALESAATRGVDVQLVVPKQLDSVMVGHASRSFFDELLDAGVRIFQFDGGLLHAKTVTIDREVGVIGSSNFDMRSFFLNFEVTLFVYDSDVASTLRWLQVSYLEDSEELDPAKWRQRPVPRRFLENSFRLLGPLF